VQWSSYEIFSVLSGIALVGLALVPGVKAKDRVFAVLGGLFLLGYGFYVAAQTEGTWRFPVMIFVLPFAVVGLVLVDLAKRRRSLGSGGDGRRENR